MICLQSKLKDALYGPVEALLEGAAEDTWPAIRKLLRNETKTIVFEFTDALSGYEMDEDAKKNHISTLENYAIDVVEGKTKEEASKVLHRMKERYYMELNELKGHKSNVPNRSNWLKGVQRLLKCITTF